MPIYFYLPEQYMPDSEAQKSWESGQMTQLHASGKIACAQCWIYQTWVFLKQAGADVRLVHRLPDSGMIVSLSNCLDQDFRASKEQFVIAIVADFLPHVGASWQVVQNPNHTESLPRSSFIPLWPQPNIIPRDSLRGERFETLAFFGHEPNLAPELRDADWKKIFYNSTGVNFEIRDAERWSDYSDVDCALGIRDFTRQKHIHKPATKLYNAWLAGIPFIGGNDSAFQAERKSPFDYFQVYSPNDIIECVQRLKSNAEFREETLRHVRKRAQEFTPEAIRQRWLDFFRDIASEVKAWEAMSPLQRSTFFLRQKLGFFVDRKLRR
ncbi:MAG: glycosyltransferase [Chthoniobacterales bacterium]